jgi:hypothetical protein
LAKVCLSIVVYSFGWGEVENQKPSERLAKAWQRHFHLRLRHNLELEDYRIADSYCGWFHRYSRTNRTAFNFRAAYSRDGGAGNGGRWRAKRVLRDDQWRKWRTQEGSETSR